VTKSEVLGSLKA